MHNLTIQFKNGADCERFRRFVETCQKIDGTPGALPTSLACAALRDSALPELSEKQEEERGNTIAAILQLKQLNAPDWDAPRYHTEWGSKTALGLCRTIAAIISGELPR